MGDLFGSLGFGLGSGGMLGMFWIVMIIVVALGICGTIIWFFWSKKAWNLKVKFRLPRSVKYLGENETLDINDIEGVIEYDEGKGSYNAKKGVVWLKRKGKRKVKMKPFRVQKYLQIPSGGGKPILEVLQVGAEDYVPVMPESYLIMEDDETGEQVAVLDVKTDSSESRAWQHQFEREAKSTYSIQGALSALLTNPLFIAGLVIFLWGLQLLILYNRMGK